MNKKEWMKKLRQEGFTDLRVFPIKPGFDSGEHTHDKHSVHVILTGALTIIDKKGTKTFHSGDKIEFPAGATHSARGGTKKGSMIIGVRK